MRLPVLAVLSVLSVGSVGAQEASLFEQYEDARKTFLGDLGAEDYAVRMPAKLLDGIEGTWFTIGIFAPETKDEKFFGQVCEQFPVVASVTSPWSFSLEAKTGIFTTVTDYTSRGGSMFASRTDPTAMLERYHVDDETPLSLIKNLLADANGEANVTRPSADILVIQGSGPMPAIYARCDDYL